jgi:hypothetical protein
MAGRKMADFRFACAPARLKAPEGSSSFCPSSFCKTIRGVRNDDQCRFEYLENGALLGWLVDPIEKKVYIHYPNQALEIPDNLHPFPSSRF